MVLVDSNRISRVPSYSGIIKTRLNVFMYRTITFYGKSFQIFLLTFNFLTCQFNCNWINNYPTTLILQDLQIWHNISLGYSHFVRHYSGNHFCFLFLWLLRCFSSPGSLTLQCDISSICRVTPFGNLRIKVFVPLPTAYRSLSRPSSPLRAKAFPLRS